jgi:nitronate monooxygenase
MRAVPGAEHPIMQAPMGGGPTTPALVAAVAGTGGLGSVAGGYLSPAQLQQEIDAVRRLTDRPFAVNLFAGGETDGASDIAPMLELLARWHDSLGLPAPQPPELPSWTLEDQVAVVEAARVAVVSFTFGIPPADMMERLRRAGSFLIGTATTVDEARLIEAAGFDAVVAQGAEAGAHRGTFASPFEAALIGTMSLVPQVVDAVAIPVVAAGGIMDGRGVAAAQALGAVAVQMGTAFLLADEARTSAPYRKALLAARSSGVTVLTRAFSGRPARAVPNAFSDDVAAAGVAIPPYPVQHYLTRRMRAEAARQGKAEALSLWAGQGVGLIREGGAADLVRGWLAEVQAMQAAPAQ